MVASSTADLKNITHAQSTPPSTDTRARKSTSNHNAEPRTESTAIPRHSPAIPLAPLEFLQSQRRGSITDPSLHAASSNQHAAGSSNPANFHPPGGPFRHPESASSSTNHVLSHPRPAANYVFGESTVGGPSAEPLGHQMRRILRSPTSKVTSGSSAQLTGGPMRPVSSPAKGQGALGGHVADQMNSGGNSDKQEQSGSQGNLLTRRQARDIDQRARRGSVTAGGDAGGGSTAGPQPHGVKRKMSSDRGVHLEEIDPQLVDGPDARMSKRRGSAVETQRTAETSVYERRYSVDSRAGPSSSSSAATSWYGEERRGSVSMFPDGSSRGGGYSPAFADLPHGRAPAPPGGIAATFAWPSASVPSQHPEQAGLHSTIMQTDQETNIQHDHNHSFEPTSPITMLPPVSFPQDRRMSVPDNIPPASGPTRNLRSRPPSRQARSADHANTAQAQPAISAQDDAGTSPDPSSPASTSKGNAPYARSPELRVSHKLAERKRRKEMKDLFDELRDQLPADRGMKASKWEILSKAIDFLVQLKMSHEDMVEQIKAMKAELTNIQQNVHHFPPGGPPPHTIIYSHPAAIVPGQYPQHPPGPMSQVLSHPSVSRPPSSQNTFPANDGSAPHAAGPNGNSNQSLTRTDGPAT